MIRPRVYEISTLGPCEEITVGYPSPLTEAELSEFKEMMALVFKKLERRAVAQEAGTKQETVSTPVADTAPK